MHFGNFITETFSEYTLYSRRVKIVFEKSEYSWDVQTSMILLLHPLHKFPVLSLVRELFKDITHKSALSQDCYEWQGMWEDIGRYLS